jgi:hypothetical protein
MMSKGLKLSLITVSILLEFIVSTSIDHPDSANGANRHGDIKRKPSITDRIIGKTEKVGF